MQLLNIMVFIYLLAIKEKPHENINLYVIHF